ncbi:MAG: hypothetical protein L3J93_04870 [Thermoplasmata archaeon]|nr:hypothetical protein [Thermoplasmata archaeon]
MRAIIAGAVALPKARFGSVAVFAPDEDAFTLAVEAADRLPGIDTSRVETLHLVGPLPSSLPDAFPDALGTRTLGAIRYAPGPAGLWAAVEAANAGSKPESIDLILAFDPGRSPIGSSAPEEDTALAALAVTEGVGLRLTGRTITTSSSSRPRRSRTKGSSRPARPEDVSGTLPPIWIRRELVQTPDGNGNEAQGRPNLADRAAGPGPHRPNLLPIIEALREIGAGRGTPDAVALVDPLPLGAETVTFESTAPIAWTSPLEPASSRGMQSESAALDRTGSVPAAISEGAYVPRSTYLANRPSRWRLAAEECGACNAISFPLRGECRTCGRSDRMRRIELPRQGLVVEASTTIRPGAQPTEVDHQVAQTGPYSVLIARAHPSVRITVQLTDSPAGAIRMGDTVDLVLRRVYPMEGEWRYGLKAIPAAREGPPPPRVPTGPHDDPVGRTRETPLSKRPKGSRSPRQAS